MRVYPELTQDGEFQALGDEGHTGSLNDRQYSFFEKLEFPGALPDKFKAWSTYVPPEPEEPEEPPPEEPVEPE